MYTLGDFVEIEKNPPCTIKETGEGQIDGYATWYET